ncbi:MAG: hypothetical protein ACXWCG_06225, partial [Flavitalea sp.]
QAPKQRRQRCITNPDIISIILFISEILITVRIFEKLGCALMAFSLGEGRHEAGSFFDRAKVMIWR